MSLGKRILIFGMIGFVLILNAFAGWAVYLAEFHDNPAAVSYNDPRPVVLPTIGGDGVTRWEVVPEPKVKPGDSIIFFTVQEKFTTAPFVGNRWWMHCGTDNPVLAPIPISGAGGPPSFYAGPMPPITVPIDMPPGNYYFKSTFKYQVNPFANREAGYTTVCFEVLPMDTGQ